MKKRSDNSGFALVITLVVIAIAATALAAAAGRSCHAVMEAGTAMEEIQIRWGALSCRELSMSRAEWMLMKDAKGDQVPAPATRRSIVLGGITFDLIFSDEQAKANANALASSRDKADLAHALMALQKDLNHITQVRLRPSKPNPKNPDSDHMLYSSFDQILVAPRPGDLISADRFRRSAGDRITCWSNGKVNFKRADRQVLRVTLAGLLNEGQIAELINYRDQSPDCTLMEALEKIEMPDSEIRDRDKIFGEVMEILTDMSLCHGLWVIAHGGARNYYSFHVRRNSDQRHWSFQW